MSERRGARDERRQAGRYEIRVTGHLDGRWAAWFDGLSLRHERDGVTVIHGLVGDQAALHGVLHRVRDTGLPLVSVIRVEDEARGPDREPGTPTSPNPPNRKER